MTAAGDDDESVRATAMRDHLQWLAGQRVEHARMSDGTDDSEVYCTGVASSSDREVYRSIDTFCALGIADDEAEGAHDYHGLDGIDSPVYRSLAGIETGDARTGDADVDASWLRGTRPPLLKRQRACSDLFSPPSASAYSQDIAH